MPSDDNFAFDVFLSHNSRDKQAVIALAEALRGRGVKVWLDVWELAPGSVWQKELEHIIATTKTAAVLVGGDGLGPWEEPEMRACLNQFVKRKLTVIPVLLPGAPEEPELPLFLQDFTWLDLRGGLSEEGVGRLVWGITGVKSEVPEDGPDGEEGGGVGVDAARRGQTRLRFRLREASAGQAGTRSAGVSPRVAQAGISPPVARCWFSPQWPVTDAAVFGREEELALLDRAWEEGKLNIVALVAAGGVGKTALVNRWANYNMQGDGWRGAARVFGWSFYSQGSAEGRHSSTDTFLDKALRWFGDEETADSPLGAYDKGTRLAELVREQKTLLLLDGAEPLQEPPGVAAEHPGQVRDPGLKGLLRGLATGNPGLCVVSTRVPVADLKPYMAVGGAASSMDLEGLTPATGAEYLGSMGVDGSKAELLRASEEFGNNALALTLLGRLLVKYLGGDIRKRDEVPDLLRGKEQGRHAKRVMAWYAKTFDGTPEGELLHVLGLFDRPAEPGAIDALRRGEAIDGLTGRLQALSREDLVDVLGNLSALRLIAWDKHNPGEQAAPLDCHPLVREYFGERLRAERPETWKAAHDRLYEYYKALPDKDLPDTVEEMAPLFQAVIHGCHAGRHQEAMDEVYGRRIQRGNESYSTHNLGAFGAELSALAGFFDPPWKRPVDALTEADQSFVLNEAAFDLRALGRLAEAVEPMDAGLEAVVALKDWNNAPRYAGNVSELSLTLGRVAQAVDYGEQGVRYADDSGDAFMRMASRAWLGDTLHQAGRWTEAADAFREAEAIQEERQPEYPLLYSLPGFLYCDLILAQGDTADAHRRGHKFFEWRVPSDSLLDIALDHLTLGRAGLALALEAGSGGFAEAEEELHAAVDGLRKAGRQDYLPRGLLARAGLYRVQLDFVHARQDLEEAWEIATRGGMRLFECDVHLECARVLRDMESAGEVWDVSTLPPDSPFVLFPTVREHVEAAQGLIEETGYHRRDEEVRELGQ